MGQLRVGHVFDRAAKQNLARWQAHFVADFAGDKVVVARQHFHDDAVLLQRGNGLGGGFLGRIQKGDVPFENQVRFVRFGVGGALVHLFVGHGQDPETVGAQVIVFLHQIAHQNRFHRKTFPFGFELAAAAENRFGRALGQNLVIASGRFDDDGHHPAREIERDFIHLPVIFNRELFVDVLMLQHGAVQHIFESGLEMADEIGVEQDGIALVLEDVAMDFQDDVVAGEGAGFVRAEDIHGAEVLDGIEALDDDFLARH